MENNQLVVSSREKFELACKEAGQLQLANNVGAAFVAAVVVSKLREALTDEVVNKVFMPLMNTKIGFLTDKPGRDRKTGQVTPLYDVETVRLSIIDAVTIGLLPTGNQFNIIAGRMYPTKEGYTHLLKRLGVKYFLDVSYDKGSNQNYAEIPVKINYEHDGVKNSFLITATVKKDNYSSHDQLRGKAERRAKKALFEYITGCDFGDADEDSGRTVDAKYELVSDLPAEVKDELSENLLRCSNLDELTALYESLDESLKNDEMVRKMFSARKAVLNAGAGKKNGNGNTGAATTNGSTGNTGNGNGGNVKKSLL